jgi:hypothetical protein
LENLTSIEWSALWYNTILIVGFILIVRLLVSKQALKVSNAFLTFLSLIILVYIVNEPVSQYSDKWVYIENFDNIFESKLETASKDLGFYLLTYVVKVITDSYSMYFFVIGFCYFYGYLRFIKHFFSNKYQFIVFFSIISALGFYAYGTNTLRQGLALSIFLLALVYKNNKFKSILFSILAVLIHKSLIIPIVAFWVVKKYDLKNNYIYFWLICLVATIFLGSSVGVVLGDVLVSSDSRIEGYLYGEYESYQAGFKLNFLIYSAVPIIYGLKMKGKLNDEIYNQILSLYIVVNAVWLLMIRIAFTDRFAYLSWFLIPFIFLYPLSQQQIFKNQNHIIALILFYLTIVTFLISTK